MIGTFVIKASSIFKFSGNSGFFRYLPISLFRLMKMHLGSYCLLIEIVDTAFVHQIHCYKLNFYLHLFLRTKLVARKQLFVDVLQNMSFNSVLQKCCKFYRKTPVWSGPLFNQVEGQTRPGRYSFINS